MNAKARQFSLANYQWFLQFAKPSNGSKVPIQPAEEWKPAQWKVKAEKELEVVPNTHGDG